MPDITPKILIESNETVPISPVDSNLISLDGNTSNVLSKKAQNIPGKLEKAENVLDYVKTLKRKKGELPKLNLRFRLIEEQHKALGEISEIEEVISKLPLEVDKVQIDLRRVLTSSKKIDKYYIVITMFDKFGNKTELCNDRKKNLINDIGIDSKTFIKLKKGIKELLPYMNDVSQQVVEKFNETTKELTYKGYDIENSNQGKNIKINGKFSDFYKELIIDGLKAHPTLKILDVAEITYISKDVTINNRVERNKGGLEIKFENGDKKIIYADAESEVTLLHALIEGLQKINLNTNEPQKIQNDGIINGYNDLDIFSNSLKSLKKKK